MSDYGDDLSDYGDDWMYIEDEYMPADDLAEHVVHSPPPTAYADDDADELDRFDYFIDLDYASDGYDDAEFYTHEPQPNTAGHKRKRSVLPVHSKKKRKLQNGVAVSSSVVPQRVCSPVVWRQQTDRGVEPKLVEADLESYAILSDWRERLADAPAWPTAPSQDPSSQGTSTNPGKASTVDVPEITAPAPVSDEDDDEDAIGSGALLAALQKNMAAAGGPLSGMDPQQLLQFAMRMMNDQDAGDDIAGELADDLLAQDQGEEDDTEEGPAGILEWLSKQRNGRPPTPPTSEMESADDHNAEKPGHAAGLQKKAKYAGASGSTSGTKRKVESSDARQDTEAMPKKRAPRSFDAPTAASYARALHTAKPARGPSKRS